MGKLQTKSDDKLGVKLTGTPEQGQHITLNQDAALQAIFGTQHPESADLRAHPRYHLQRWYPVGYKAAQIRWRSAALARLGLLHHAKRPNPRVRLARM